MNGISLTSFFLIISIFCCECKTANRQETLRRPIHSQRSKLFSRIPKVQNINDARSLERTKKMSLKSLAFSKPPDVSKKKRSIANDDPGNQDSRRAMTQSVPYPTKRGWPRNKPRGPKHRIQNRICRTIVCNVEARLILRNMDEETHPCDNFYQFACGNYINGSNPEEANMTGSVSDEAITRLYDELKKGIEENIDKSDSRTFRLIKSHYNSCLDTEEVERTSTKELLNILNKLGGWPVLVGESWNGSAFDWKNLIYQTRRMGYKNSMHSFIWLRIEVDDKNSTGHVIGLYQATTGLEFEYLIEGIKGEKVQAYRKYMINAARALGVNKERARKELFESLNFEIQLAKISEIDEDPRNKSQLYNPMTINELEIKYPGVPWNKYINELLKPHYSVKSNDRVIVRNLNYFKTISDLIARTPKRVLANYVIWRVIQESIPFMNEQFLKIETKYLANFTGTGALLSRWEQCIYHVKENMPVAVGALYATKLFDEDLKIEVKKLVDAIRRTFENSIEKIDWMSEKTRIAALKKLRRMHAHVAYPDELLDSEKVDKYFEEVKFIPESYLDSYLTLSLFNLDRTFQQLGKPHNKTDWTNHAAVAVFNAHYSTSENSFQIPAGYIQPELFVLDRPDYMNYAAFSETIAHEFTHGFDDESIQYDEEGNLVDWLDHETQKEYKKRVECIVDQYSQYTSTQIDMNNIGPIAAHVRGIVYYYVQVLNSIENEIAGNIGISTKKKSSIKVDGVNTLAENIADNNGVKQAYLAYEEYERRNSPEPRLPGLPYSPRQLFWISYANIYCGKDTPEAVEHEMITDAHSPSEFRVIGTLSNMPQFARDFQCPLGSFMNPFEKCAVW